jgi:hypothetical protein
MTDHLTFRAQRLIEEFEEGDDVRHGIANVLKYLANAWDSYSHGDECWHGVTTDTLEDFMVELTAPTLLDRALAGEKDAARQFLFEAGFTDEHGQLTAPYRSKDLNDD